MNQAVLYVKTAVVLNVANMKIILKEFKEPTNVYICACSFNNIDSTFCTDDDEHSLYITDGESVNILQNYGHITIVTDKEFKENLNNLQSWDSEEIQYLHEYIGTIELCSFIPIDETFQNFNINEYDKELDLNDFICHQIEEYNEFCLKVDYGYSTNLWWKPFSSSVIGNLI